jgi:putative SOS response-associated peptidase YedK
VCGRFTNTAGPGEIGRQLGQPLGVPIDGTAGTTGRYNVAPTEQVLAIVERDGHPESQVLRWALVPAKAETTKTRYPLINARVETLRSTGRYAGIAADAAHRALILADGFYEWPQPEDQGAKHKLRPPPLHFQVDGGRVFGFAGLWTTSPNVEGGAVSSCTIVTCDSAGNRVVAPVHDRMPVILADVERMRAWLDPSVSAREALSLCEPLPAERMSARLASQAVNSVRSPEGPELLVASS